MRLHPFQSSMIKGACGLGIRPLCRRVCFSVIVMAMGMVTIEQSSQRMSYMLQRTAVLLCSFHLGRRKGSGNDCQYERDTIIQEAPQTSSRPR